MKNDCKSKIRYLPENLIYGSDISNQVIQNAKINAKNLPDGDKIKFSVKPFDESQNFENGIIITNPPYGIRMQNKSKAQELIKQFGDFLKNKCKNTTAYIFVGDKELRKHVGLKTTRKIPLVSGSLDGRLLQIDIY